MERKRVGDINEEELLKVLKKFKNGKSAGLDVIPVDFLKNGDEIIVKWIRKLLNVCLNNAKVPKTLKYHDKGDRNEFTSYKKN